MSRGISFEWELFLCFVPHDEPFTLILHNSSTPIEDSSLNYKKKVEAHIFHCR